METISIKVSMTSAMLQARDLKRPKASSRKSMVTRLRLHLMRLENGWKLLSISLMEKLRRLLIKPEVL